MNRNVRDRPSVYYCIAVCYVTCTLRGSRCCCMGKKGERKNDVARAKHALRIKMYIIVMKYCQKLMNTASI